MQSIHLRLTSLLLILSCILFNSSKIDSTLYAEEKEGNVDSVLSLLQPGAPAPINVLKDISNKEITFPSTNKWNLIFYWSLFCHSCIEEMPEIQTSLEKLKGDNLSTFFISLDSEKMQKALVNFKKRRKFSAPILMEKVENDKYITADTWGVTMTPSVFIINPEGKIVFSHQGPLDLDLFIKNLPQEISSCPQNNIASDTSGVSNEQ